MSAMCSLSVPGLFYLVTRVRDNNSFLFCSFLLFLSSWTPKRILHFPAVLARHHEVHVRWRTLDLNNFTEWILICQFCTSHSQLLEICAKSTTGLSKKIETKKVFFLPESSFYYRYSILHSWVSLRNSISMNISTNKPVHYSIYDKLTWRDHAERWNMQNDN